MQWKILQVMRACALVGQTIVVAHASLQLLDERQPRQVGARDAMVNRPRDERPSEPIRGAGMTGNVAVDTFALLRTSEDARRTNIRGNNESNTEPENEDPFDADAATLLKYPWWVKIREESGRNSFNYVPGSRRAASSVVYAYKSPQNDERALLSNGVVNNQLNISNSFDEGGVRGVNVTNNAIQSPNGTSPTNSTGSTEALSNEHVNESPKSQAPGSMSDAAEDERIEEYMIISGGYTYRDWRTFPVYAFPITSAERTRSGEWIDLSPSEAEEEGVDPRCREEDDAAARERLFQEAKFLDNIDGGPPNDDPWERASPCAPSGRMGHISGIHDDRLYVFGGLIYDEELAFGGYRKRETFRMEDVPFVYRLDLKEMFDRRRAESGGGHISPGNVTGWQRIIPSVKPYAAPGGVQPTFAAEVLLSYVNRGEMQGGLWSSKDSMGGHDKLVMYGGLRISNLVYEGHGHGAPSKFVKGETAFGPSSSQMVLSHKIVELPLGDVWAYDFVLNCWERITNGSGRGIIVPVVTSGTKTEKNSDATDNKLPTYEDDDVWGSDLGIDASSYPRPRTAHAATVVGSQLVVHGGMGFSGHLNEWDGSTEWETLDDMWILDLNTRQWTRRWLSPPLVRSYHSLVGWSAEVGCGVEFDNCTSREGPVVAAFGGYTTGVDVISGEEVAYVFDDLLVSYPPSSKKFSDILLHPTEINDLGYENSPTPWLKAIRQDSEGVNTISIRYQHSAVLSSEGVLTVWGGNFQTTAQIDGVWMIDIAGTESTINLEMAGEDAIFDDMERTITALHTMIIMLMFMSMSLTLLLGLTQRYQEFVSQANDDAAMATGIAMAAQDFGGDVVPTRRGNGLHPEIINTIPRKIFARDNDATEEGEQCCPICLVDYSDGDELRVLPCGHYLHRSCLDAWLASNPSCPSCRYSLRELVDDRSMLQLRTLRSRLTNHTAFVRFLGNDYADDIEMTDAHLPRRTIIDLQYLSSSLSLSEVNTATESIGGRHLQGDTVEDPDQRHHTAIGQIRDWRSRRRHLQRERRLPNFRGRDNHRRSRVPSENFDES